MTSILIGVLIDWILGDPYSFPHPVKLMGNIISSEEKFIRKHFKEESFKILGLLMALFNIAMAFGLTNLILKLVSFNPYLYPIVKIYLIYTCIAARSLHYEGIKVYEALGQGLDSARLRLSYIVGRETQKLQEEDIIKATIETVAENTSDGVIAPILFIMIFGPAGGMMYKMVNTMDSMIGYKNEKYINLGSYPARIDDLYNYIPARITGLLMVLASVFKYDYKQGFKIMIRDRKNHSSPNASYPEGAVAGLLGIQLGGDNFYHGKLVEKPTLGDDLNPIEKDLIKHTIWIMYRSEISLIILYIVFYLLV